MSSLVTENMAIKHAESLFPPGSILEAAKSISCWNSIYYPGTKTTRGSSSSVIKSKENVLFLRAESQNSQPWMLNLVILHNGILYCIPANALFLDEMSAGAMFKVVSRASKRMCKSKTRAGNLWCGVRSKCGNIARFCLNDSDEDIELLTKVFSESTYYM